MPRSNPVKTEVFSNLGPLQKDMLRFLAKYGKNRRYHIATDSVSRRVAESLRKRGIITIDKAYTNWVIGFTPIGKAWAFSKKRSRRNPSTYRGKGSCGGVRRFDGSGGGRGKRTNPRRFSTSAFFPSIADVRKTLTALWKSLQNSPNFWMSDGVLEVRLQVLPSGYWQIHTGDPSYDQDHRGYWGASYLTYERQNLTDLVKDLLDQAAEQHAMEG